MTERHLYKGFSFPLNLFMHILTSEEGRIDYLHYGLFESGDESIVQAQEKATQLLLDKMPPPPAKVLDVGSGLGTTLATLTDRGYEAQGITPEANQIAVIRQRHGENVTVTCAPLETVDLRSQRFDVIVFQESSQYIEDAALFARVDDLLAPHGRVIVLDEFALRPLQLEGALHNFTSFLAAADSRGFRVVEEADLSLQAAPTITYIPNRVPKYRQQLLVDLGITDEQIDALLESGERYRRFYANGDYGYKLLVLERSGHEG